MLNKKRTGLLYCFSPHQTIVFVKLPLVLLTSFLLSGCYVIGLETVAPDKDAISKATIGNHVLRTSRDGRTARLYNLANGGMLEFPNWNGESTSTSFTSKGDYTVNSGTQITSFQFLTDQLGCSVRRTEDSAIYTTGKRSWHGVILDAAIFPVPLALPLIIPGKTDGYIEISSDVQGIIHIKEYRTRSRLYGIWGDDSGSGCSSGSAPGFWFSAD